MITSLTDSELWDVASLVDRHHEIFYILFTAGSVVWNDEMKTLGVCFPKKPDEKPSIQINKELWQTLSDYDKEFLVCHECLHILLQHNIRQGADKFPFASAKLVNVAQDITINELLLSMFGFDFNSLSFCQQGCFVRTVFPDVASMPTNKNMMFYLEMLLDKEQKTPGSTDILPDSQDQHDDQTADEVVNDIWLSPVMLSTIAEKLGEEDVKEINKVCTGKDTQARGYSNLGTGGFDDVIPKYTPVKPFSFHQHIKDLKRSRFSRSPKLISTFTHSDRRYATLAHQSNLRMPGHIEDERVIVDKLNTKIFMDVSGSCTAFVDDFYKMFGHIEQFKDLFDISTYTFNDRVTKVDLKKRNLRLGGGTNFQIIEDECLSDKKYPDLVIVITDGDASRFQCKHPENWMWFLITPRISRHAIDAKAKVIVRDQIQL